MPIGLLNAVRKPFSAHSSPTSSKPVKRVQIRTSSEGPQTVERTAIADRNDPDYIRELQRPAEIKCDLHEMDRRKRVRQVLEHKDFCDQLESQLERERLFTNCVMDVQPGESSRPFGRKTLGVEKGEPVETAEPAHITVTTALTGLQSLTLANRIVKICDFTAHDKHSVRERHFRNKLASLYRLVDLLRWSQGIYNHITLRLPETGPNNESEFLINPFGLLYHEITASSLIKIDINGNVLDNGSTDLGVNKAGYVLHSAIHKARADVKCVLHLHTPVVTAVSAMKCGLLPICQEAMIIGKPSYHDYMGIVCEETMRQKIVEDLGDANVLILRNHGFVACGESVEDALHLAFHTIIACETQIRVMNIGLDNLVIPLDEAVQHAYTTARHGGGGVNKTANPEAPVYRIGELEWEAWMRVLDHAGFQTGHIYRNPALKSRLPTPNYRCTNFIEIAIPPAGGLIDADVLERACPRQMDDKTRWFNSPNSYQRVKVEEIGHEKVVTKWVSGEVSGNNHATPVKVSSLHQFSSVNGDAQEFRKKQHELKEIRARGETSPGPQSQVFCIQENQPAAPGHFTTISTASKGIIERPFQHDARIYSHLYAPNPFVSETPESLQRYVREVELKWRPASAMEQRDAARIDASPAHVESLMGRSKSFDSDTEGGKNETLYKKLVLVCQKKEVRGPMNHNFFEGQICH